MLKVISRLKQTSSIFLALFFCLLIAACLAPKSFMNNDRTGGVYSPDVRAILDGLQRILDEEGLDALLPYPVGYLARPRPQEIAAALNRFRGIRMVPVLREVPTASA